MGVAADTGDTFDAEVEWDGGKTGAGKERDDEGAETTIDMEWERPFLSEGEARESWDIVDDAVGEVWCRTYKKDCVAVN